MKSCFRVLLVAGFLCSLFILSSCGGSSKEEKGTAADAPTATVAVPTASTPAPAASAGTIQDLTPLGLPIYPTVYESGWTAGDPAVNAAMGAAASTLRVGQMSTHDSFDDVYAWYRKQMPAGSESEAAAASNHTTDDGDRMAVFEVGTNGDPAYQRIMLLHGKADDYTVINLAGHVSK
jgi:hypothetical protein